METPKFKIIKSKAQYDRYCRILEELVTNNSKSKEIRDEIELLTFLIEKWDADHNTFDDLNPVELLHSLMKENNLKAKDLAQIPGVNKSWISEILNFKKSLSKDLIRTLSSHFKVSQESFNRSHKRKGSTKQLEYA